MGELWKYLQIICKAMDDEWKCIHKICITTTGDVMQLPKAREEWGVFVCVSYLWLPRVC